ncbi:MAG: thioredoxin-disulfide reductase [Candidatus Omnitrophica bacterium]|nr:thioredoxin-disulfide reductase [Candidatus Omnitrophota bacterium]
MHETIIIGGGIAGDTAAIYAARKKMDFLMIAKELGGQFFESGEITNYPGIVKTDGENFSESFEDQLEANGIEPRTGEEVTKLEKTGESFKVVTDKGTYETATVIIATGSRPRKLEVPGEDEFAKKGVTYCSVCDGPLFSGKDVVIAGGGNSALEAVDFMREIAEKITLVNNAEQLNGHEYLIDKAESLEKTEIINSAEIVSIEGDKMVNAVRLKKDGQESKIETEGVIIEIGRKPNTDFLKDFLELDEKGHIKIDCQGRTSVEGVFAAGDCASGQEFQYVIAAGQGCMALLKAARYLARRK